MGKALLGLAAWDCNGQREIGEALDRPSQQTTPSKTLHADALSQKTVALCGVQTGNPRLVLSVNAYSVVCIVTTDQTMFEMLCP